MAQRVGIDLTSVTAVREAVEEHGDAYLARVYSPGELTDCQGDASRLAGRFAAKEAAIKVLRPGTGTPVPWSSIQVVRSPSGHVELQLTGLAAAHAAAEGLEDFALSMTHEGDAACAVVIAQTVPVVGGESCRCTPT